MTHLRLALIAMTVLVPRVPGAARRNRERPDHGGKAAPGESLIDYNHEINRVGSAILLTDIL